MNLDPGIICYQHCKKGRLFSFGLPSLCDLCGADLASEPLLIPPFRLPYPFVRASQVSCCVVIKPTRGDFLHDYRNAADLHIGLTDSEGTVHEFDSEGFHSDYTQSWSQCLAVPVLSESISQAPDPVWQEYWDFTLQSQAQEKQWTESRYNENQHNCYTFVIEFLKSLRPPDLCVKTLTKNTFSSRFILPHTSAAAKYISIFRRLLQEEVVAVPNTVKPQQANQTTLVNSAGITTTAF